MDGKPERFQNLLSKLVEKYGEEPESEDEEDEDEDDDEDDYKDDGGVELNEALEGRVRSFYLHYNESKLGNVRDLVLRTKNKPKYEDRLMRMLVKKYGPEPEEQLTEEQAFRARLERFYRKYQPSKLSSVGALVAKAEGKESQEQLFRMLVSKYGPEPAAEEEAKKEVKVEQLKSSSGEAGSLFREVEYCPIDGMPPEYCEFLPTFDQCLPWLLEHCPDLKLTTLDDKTVAEYVTTLETEGDTEEKKKKDTRGGKARPNKNMSKKGKKGKKEPKITIERTSRSKRKFITIVAGLDTFDLKLKEVAKKLGKRFACSASVSKLPTGGQSVDIQGDVCYELPDLLLEYFPVIDKDKIFLIEDGKESKVY